MFVLSVIDVDASLPFEIIPSHWLRKASEEEILWLKNKVHPIANSRLAFDPKYWLPPYEYDLDMVPDEKRGGHTYHRMDLPRERWRYWVVEFECTTRVLNEPVHRLSDAFLLCSPDVHLGFEFMVSPSGGFSYGENMAHVFNFIREWEQRYSGTPSMGTLDLQRVATYYDLQCRLPSDFDHIARAFRRFCHLQRVDDDSEMAIIGLFSIIESLVTHAPKLSEPADSIGHQMKTKIPLLRRRRLERPLDHVPMFGTIDEANLWSKLYRYRSKIVHGEDAKLDGELQVLKDWKTVFDFLREAAKLLLIQSLKEPELLTDLKAC